MQQELQIYIDGQFYPEPEAKVSVFDHGLLYGDGIFEGIRFYNGRVFKLTEHLERLWDSARAIMLTIPMTIAEMEAATLETIRKNGLKDGYIRLLVTRGKGNLGLSPDRCPKASVIIIAATIQLYPPEAYERGMTVVTCATRRMAPAALSPAVKSLNYLNNIMAKIEANIAKADEGLMLNEEGYVAECTGDNIFVVKRGEIYTPPIYAGSLRGITWQAVLDIATELGFKVNVQQMTRYDLYTADELFLTGTAAEVIAAVKLDNRVIGDGKPGSITNKIIARFREVAQSTGTPIYA
ncbi:branched-chain amino acid aminotransferase [Chthoniobacter flavus Ellin428]|uniref:Branched-chain-amino-acid aminotransferase n=1 Tax=Chthoniobacter flavus Ellin428 TaxID=497964 RepID=B4D3F4_9BACT|nr:branched-chain-amino-acid transaminase [Chthoniobacter flavus]EDY19265.1 branched-chain amino acid aminotransferase [Chthoniobacter flavus Ellin428]TCO88107.1 branched-chain amino acid aminotransferase [Chthoniobacter flavus]